jgi:peptidoglycan/LPS O-acetylase OafA/YrhL
VWPFRFEIVDGLRGLAALAVVMHHLQIVSVGHFAVMLFFVISGYCIAASAETCRRNGVSFRTFMWRRIRRIYPPYFFAIVFYVLTRIVKIASGAHNDLARPWLDWVQNLTLTQWVSLPFHPVADAPQNPKLVVAAFWSLNYEDQFYLVMAVALLISLVRRVPMVSSVLVLAVIGLVWNLLWPSGWITGIFIEYWVHFALGALLFYVLCISSSPAVRYAFIAAVGALGAFCASHIFPWRTDELLTVRVYAELTVVCAFTLLLLFIRPVSAAVSRFPLWRPVAALGAIAYSLYLVNQFNLTFVATVVDRIMPRDWETARLTAMLALQVAVATVFWFFCERPFLNRTPPGKGKPTRDLSAAPDPTPIPSATLPLASRPAASH